MIKTYKCSIHGEFDYECNINDPELIKCPQKNTTTSNVDIESGLITQYATNCNRPITRVFKPVGYSWKTDGFAGRGFDVGK